MLTGAQYLEWCCDDKERLFLSKIEREHHHHRWHVERQYSMMMMMSRQRRFALGWSSTLTGVKAVVENTTLLVVVTRGGSTMSSSSSSAHTHKDADFDGVDDFTVGAFGKQQQQHRLRQDHPTLTTLREEGRRRRRWKKETERRGFAATPKTKEEEEEEEERNKKTGHDFDDERILLERRRRQEQQQQQQNTSSSSSSSSIANIPNALSLARALSGPFISYMVVQGPDMYSTELVVTSIASRRLGLPDGYPRERWNQTSNFGSFFDAAADKIFVSSIGVGMAVSGKLPAWMIGVFVIRDCGFLASGVPR